MSALPIARELLAVERERLARDHYEDGTNQECDGCERAASVRTELGVLEKLDGAEPPEDIKR